MRIVKKEWLAIAAMLAMCPGVALAQQASQSSSAQAGQQSAASSNQKPKPAAAKPPKVWTEDDISSVRTPADDYMDQARSQAAAAAEPAKQTESTTKPAQTTQKSPFSNPNTVADADKWIAWDQRDIDSQQEYLQRLQNQLATAPDDQKAHIQAWIDQEIKTIADTKNEQAGLIAQKKDLEKKASSTDSGKTNPQQQ